MTDCFHCSLPIPKDDKVSAEIQNKTRSFCCHGCKAVCEAIYASGLQGFYDRTSTTLAPPPESSGEYDHYDLDEIQQAYITHNDDSNVKTRSIQLLVEGIHCAACVWLIEQHLKQLKGVAKAHVNLTLKRLFLTWDNDKIKLSQIMERLKAIGYVAVPFDQEIADERLKKQNQKTLYRLAFAGFAMMNLMWISIALYSGADQGEFRLMFYWVGFFIATPTLLYSGMPFLKGAWTGLKNRHLSMDLPISIGALVTWGYSSIITSIETFSGYRAGDVYFDTVVNFMFVILIGRYLEGISKRKAVISTERLLNLQPKTAIQVVDNKSNTEKISPVASLKKGDWVKVRPGGFIPIDGVIVDGNCDVDESMLTGESTPVFKKMEDRVFAGSLNKNGFILVEVDAILNNTSLGKIVSLVEQAQGSKAPIQCIADRVVPWFVFATLSLALLSFTFWINTDLELALMTATAVLIITCPCAFGLATPMAISVATGMAAKLGILIRNGEVLEHLSEIKHYIFDKTGTLTYGKPAVQTLHIIDEKHSKEKVIAYAASLEQNSEHPVADAIIGYAKENGIRPQKTSAFKAYPGQGVSAVINGETVKIGSISWLHDQADILPGICLTINDTLAAQFVIHDQLRPEAVDLIKNLTAEGIKLTLLSGDTKNNADIIAQQLMARGGKIDVIADVLPEDKDRVISDFQKRGEKVVMIGDGINDAPALVRSDVGMAMGSGTDVSIASSDIVLLGGDLSKVYLASALSRRTIMTIYQNIAVSISYNIIMVPLAMMAFVTPLVAAISMPISSLLVIGNAARLRKFTKS